MRCEHYMVRSPTYIREQEPLSSAIALMVKKHMQDLLIVKEDGRFFGEITAFVFSQLLLPPDPAAVPAQGVDDETAEDVDNRLLPYLDRKVGEFADREIPVVHPETPLTEALRLLSAGRLRLPVVEEGTGQLVGALSSLTILRRYGF
jgi:CBS domain-containing protein